jgi:3-hydroxyisobutyrate dehydrogenase-like beta-hydroxyacid dehydrogenase
VAEEGRVGTVFRVGYAGVGLMGHGAAKNILEKGGHRLMVIGNRNREPVDDLVRRGASEGTTLAALAADCDVVFLCLPSTVQVEEAVYGEHGLLKGAHGGLTVVDSTTADPTSTRRIGADLAARGASMVDGPLGRSPREAEAGNLNTFLGGSPEAIARVRPIIETYADTIIETGPLGSAHTMKLLNNFISIANNAIIAEAVATATKMGVDLRTFYNVVTSGGANSAMFQMVMPWPLEGDDTRLRGPMRIAGKDLRYYCRMAEAAGAPSFMAQTANQIYQLANARGHGERFMPVLSGIMAELIGTKVRDLP